MIPKTFVELLALAQEANVVAYCRAGQTLSLIVDDVAADRRTCVDARLDRLVADFRTLKGHDPKENRWGDYCEPSGRVDFPDRRGLKALREWLAVQATAKTGHPNPESFSVVRKAA